MRDQTAALCMAHQALDPARTSVSAAWGRPLQTGVLYTVRNLNVGQFLLVLAFAMRLLCQQNAACKLSSLASRTWCWHLNRWHRV